MLGLFWYQLFYVPEGTHKQSPWDDLVLRGVMSLRQLLSIP